MQLLNNLHDKTRVRLIKRQVNWLELTVVRDCVQARLDQQGVHWCGDDEVSQPQAKGDLNLHEHTSRLPKIAVDEKLCGKASYK